MAGVESIYGQHEARAEDKTKKPENNDKEMFLKLLVAQLTYQDPLNPAEDTEFIAQLAQFTQVEELQNIRSSVEDMYDLSVRGQFTSAVGLVNKNVSAAGSNIWKQWTQIPKMDDQGNLLDENGDPLPEGDDPVMVDYLYTDPVYYSTETDVVSCTITILDSSLGLIYQEEMGPRKAGELYGFRWEGMNSFGQEPKDGLYTISITGKDAGGNSQLFTTEISGKVSAVENIDGEYVLHLADKRQVKYTDVTMVQ